MASSGTCGYQSRHADPAAEVRGDLRLLLEQREFEPYDPERDRDRLDDALCGARDRRAAIGSRSRSPVSRSGRSRTSRRCSTRSRSSGRPRSSPQPGGRGDRHWQDRDRRPGLPAPCAWRRPALAAFRRAPTGNPGAVAPDLPRGPGRRRLRRAVCRRSRPERWKHVFASVQSLTSYGVANIPADAFDVVVIDEFHHAEARTYRRILDHLDPANSSASPRRRSAPTASTCAPSSMGAPPPSCGSGMRSAQTCCARSTTSSSRMGRTSAQSPGRAAATTRRSSTTLHRQRRPRGDRASASSATRSPTLARCVALASASASPTPSTWRASSTRPASPPRAVSGHASA